MLALLSFSFVLLFAARTQGVDAQDACSVCEEVHFFLARGNNEPYPGRQAMLVEATCNGLTSCGYEDLYYGALYTDIYCQSAYDGSIAGHVQMTAYAEKCPNSKLILSGYSQGGQIIGDILGGGGGYNFNGCYQPETPAMSRDTSPGNKVAAAIVFGDTRHDANMTYNYGNGSAIEGYFPRNATMKANLETYADILRNWCVSTDPICAANQSYYNDESHLNYFDLDSQAAASWIRSVASLTSSISITTVIPTSVSGTVQDYATIGTATPSGSVTIDTTWTSSTSYASCTETSYTQATLTATANITSSESSAPSTKSGSVTASVASVFPLTGSASTTGSKAEATSSASGASGRGASHDQALLMLGLLGAAGAILRIV